MTWTTAYLPLGTEVAAAEVGAVVSTGPEARPLDGMAQAAPDLTATGVAVVITDGWAPGRPLTVLGKRAMLHHLASAADVEIPVLLMADQATAPGIPQEDVDALLSATMLQVLVAVS